MEPAKQAPNADFMLESVDFFQKCGVFPSASRNLVPSNAIGTPWQRFQRSCDSVWAVVIPGRSALPARIPQGLREAIQCAAASRGRVERLN